MAVDILPGIQRSYRSNSYRFTYHGLQEATADDLTVEQVRSAIIHSGAEIVEDYPDHPRGACCLILGWLDDGQPIHAVVSYPTDVTVITVYRPDERRWPNPRFRRLS